MKRYLGFICILYSMIIFYIWIFDLLKNYLAPQMQIYLKISAILLCIIGLVLIINNKIEYKFKIRDLILLLPLLALIIAQDARLSSNFAQNRMVNNKSEQRANKENQEENNNVDEDVNENKEVIKEDINEIEEKDEQIKYDFTKVDFNVVDASYYDLANYFTFIPSASKYSGKTIRVKGFTLLDDTYIPQGYFTIGKYNISCCAADAIFVGFYVKDMEGIKNNTWYEIEGVLEPTIDTEGMETMYINAINIKEIDSKKEEQYVYPCYAYDNGSCKEISKYDIDY